MTDIIERIVNQHIAILGKTGSGKTYTAKGIAEMLLLAKQRVCIIDPTSAYWGLRSDKDGTGPGFPITVFGGAHGDLPIEKQHGESLAEMVATSNLSAIIDVKMMTVGARTQFFAAFAETILQKNVGVLHLIIDEAHLFAPQGRVSDPQSGKMLHAANNMVSLGRGCGLRIILVSQRPAKLHKDSLTQVETLIAMRLIAPQDRNAVKDWMLEWAEPSQGAEILKSLPSLPTGEGWVWAPEINILDKMKFPEISTYDSSRAPDGAASKVVLASIDRADIEARLKAVEVDLAENDPKRLKEHIAELQQQLEDIGDGHAVYTNEEMTDIEQRGYERGRNETIAEFSGTAHGCLDRLKRFDETMRAEIETLREPLFSIAAFGSADHSAGARPVPPQPIAKAAPVRGLETPRNVQARPPAGGGNLPEGERIILTAIAQHTAGVSREQLSILSGYKRSTRDAYISRLSAKNMIEVCGTVIQATAAGRQRSVPILNRFQPAANCGNTGSTGFRLAKRRYSRFSYAPMDATWRAPIWTNQPALPAPAETLT